jgi:hypothetical protein
MNSSKKKILIHSIVFSPDGVSTAYLYNDIALRFKEEGFDVSVITTTPHYNVVKSELQKQPLKKRAFGLYYESIFKGIPVKHVYQKKYKSTILRMFGFVYWHIVSFFLSITEKNVDLILSPSPPLTIGFLNILIGKMKKAKVIVEICKQDITRLIQVTPSDKIDKYSLISLFNSIFRGGRIEIEAYDGYSVDKSLKSIRTDFDYSVPTYDVMLVEQKKWIESHKELYPFYIIEH